MSHTDDTRGEPSSLDQKIDVLLEEFTPDGKGPRYSNVRETLLAIKTERTRLRESNAALLAACERLVEIQESGHCYTEEWREFGLQIRAAIAEAKKG